MVNLNHVHGANLKDLEVALRKSSRSIMIVAINKVGDTWYIHYLAQDFNVEAPSVKVEKEIKLKKLKGEK